MIELVERSKVFLQQTFDLSLPLVPYSLLYVQLKNPPFAKGSGSSVRTFLCPFQYVHTRSGLSGITFKPDAEMTLSLPLDQSQQPQITI